MGIVVLPDELARVIERRVAEGRASTSAEFVEEAVTRLLDDELAEQNDILAVAEAGAADIAAGRYTTIETKDDERHLFEGMMARLHASRSRTG